MFGENIIDCELIISLVDYVFYFDKSYILDIRMQLLLLPRSPKYWNTNMLVMK